MEARPSVTEADCPALNPTHHVFFKDPGKALITAAVASSEAR
jgi:hypothetical protein